MFRLTMIISGFLIIILFAGCTPTRMSNRIQLSTPSNWQHAPIVSDSKPVDLKHWWQGFQDPVLNGLISQALTANHDLKIAKARVRESSAMVTVAESALYPSLDFFTSGGREKRIDRIIGVPDNQGIKLITPTASSISGGLLARWEIDLFGARHLEAEAVAAQATGRIEAKRAVQVGLLAQVATNYLELRGVQERITIHLDNINTQKEKLRTLLAFFRAGFVHESDVAHQQAALNKSTSVLATLTAAEDTLTHRLSVLLGKPPAQLRQQLSVVTPPISTVPPIPRLLPADLLLQRPDLRQAQTDVSTAAANLGAVKAELYPKLVLSVSGGFGALAVGGFSSLAESVYALGSGLTAPIFNAGRISAKITAADTRLEQVATQYEKTFLLAMEDVENAFVSYRTALTRQTELIQAETAADKAFQAIESLYRQGVTTYPSVLDAQMGRLSSMDEQVQAKTALRVSMISLYRSFGGGWENGRREKQDINVVKAEKITQLLKSVD